MEGQHGPRRKSADPVRDRTREVHVRLLLDTFRKTPAARFSLLSLGLIRSSQTLISRELANAGIYFANFRLASG